MSESIIYTDDDDDDDWPTRVELASLSEAEKKLEEIEEEEEASWVQTDAIAKTIVIVVPIVVIVTVLAVLCGVRAWRKATKLQKMQSRIRELDAERFILRVKQCDPISF